MHTLPWNSAGHTLFLFFTSFRRSKSALCHLLCEATCLLGTDKQLGNMTSVVEYSKIVTAQQLGDRIMHIIHIFWGSCIFHVSNITVELRKPIQMIISTNFLCWRGNLKNSCFVFHRVSKCSKTIKPLGLQPRAFKCFSRLETRWNTHTCFWNITYLDFWLIKINYN